MEEARVLSIETALLAETYVIVPAYNESEVIADVLSKIGTIFSNIVCVDDGSSDGTSEKAKNSRCHNLSVLRHPVNVGQGGALETGIQYAYNRGAKFFITMDADGQHRPEDAFEMIHFLQKENVDMVLGSRFLRNTSSKIPLFKKFILFLGTLITKWIHRLDLTDTHNGLRVFNRKTAAVLRFNHIDMAHASEVYDIINRNGLKYKEYPVTVEYTEYSKKKGQSTTNALNILIDFLLRRGG
ncbi:MAG: glycosyltransferase family 2 protein [Bacteriovoracia bacterium]